MYHEQRRGNLSGGDHGAIRRDRHPRRDYVPIPIRYPYPNNNTYIQVDRMGTRRRSMVVVVPKGTTHNERNGLINSTWKRRNSNSPSD